MSEISATSIATMRYAPAESSRVELYNYNGAEELTLGQLVIALCVRAGAVFERDAVVQLNVMNMGVANIEELSDWGDAVLAGTADWTNIRKRLIEKYKVLDSSLPADIASYNDNMSAMEQITQCISDQNSSVDRVAIEIETAINRRDTQYQLATETITHYGGSAMNTAVHMAPATR